MASLIIISWRDVPAQVIVKRGRETAKVQLSARFQEAVDRAAMRAGKGSSDAYLADWKRSDPVPVRRGPQGRGGCRRGAHRGELHRRAARGADPRQGPAHCRSLKSDVRATPVVRAPFPRTECLLPRLRERTDCLPPAAAPHRLPAPRAPGRSHRAPGQGTAVRLPHVRPVHLKLHRHVLPDELPEEPAQRSVRWRARERQLRSEA